MNGKISFDENKKEKESVGANHAKLFSVNNRTTDKFRFRQSVKLVGFFDKSKQRGYFWCKVNIRRIFLE